jgi:Tn7-like transposition protein D/TniQ
MTQLTSFPEPYPDEDFRSLVYRYHIRSSNEKLAETNLDLFEKNSGKYSIFPSKLTTFLSKLPIGHLYNLDYFILNHTWYGLIFSFMKDEKKKDLLEVIKYGSENSFFISSNVPNNLFSHTIRYCPLCLKEDSECYGESYIHRKHQITFMDFCYKHYVMLIDKCISCHAELAIISYSGLKIRPSCKNGHDLTIVKESILIGESEKLKIDIFNFICFFNEHYHIFNSEKITHKILMGLWQKNYIQYKGRVLKKELISSIITKYENQLQAILLSPGQIMHRYFLAEVLSKELNKNIIFYCLLILYLFGSQKEFMNYHFTIANPIPFGRGPWKCFNKICDGFNKDVISKNKRIAKSSGGMVISAEFECTICGQIYVKRWHPNKDTKEKVMIKTMGEKWINRVLQLYLNGNSVCEIAQKLECSEFGVRNNLNRIVGSSKILKAKNREAVMQIIHGYLESSGTNETDFKKEENRNIVINILNSCEYISRSNLSRKIPYAYQWLKMNDIEWLESVLPSNEGNKKIPEDLTFFDEQLAIKIKKVSKELYDTYHSQIKKTTILKKLSKIEMNRLKFMSERLPLSTVMLNKNIELLNGYLIRRLPYVIDRLLNKGLKNITIKSLESYSKNYTLCSHETKGKIVKYLLESGFSE